MNVVILNYHFQRGGVTQVVENHVCWLKQSPDINRILLVSGNRVDGLSEPTRQAAEIIRVDELEYDSSGEADHAEAKARLLVDQLQVQLDHQGIDRGETVLHWHNHSLGKNTAAPAAVRLLAELGWCSLLQIHDFAEDGRPENYRRLVQASSATSKRQVDHYLYPVADNIRYVTLTRFDSRSLGQIGIPTEKRRVLPNSVTSPTEVQPDREVSIEKIRRAMQLPPEAHWCIYPVRGIRRKNVGEFLLLSRLTPPDTYSGLTLCPTTPIERDSYRRWQRIAKQVAPRAVFDAAHHPDISFAENLAASRYAISSSVAEGFGMAFLEPWLAGCEVIARHLPSVFDDFEEMGIRFPAKYSSIPVPSTTDWIRSCLAEIEDDRQRAWSALPKRFRPEYQDENLESSSSTIDFGRLTPQRQLEVLRRAATDAAFEADLKHASAELVAALQAERDEDQIEQNRLLIRDHYSLQSTGDKLMGLYREIMATTDSTPGELTSSGTPAIDVINQSRPHFACRTEDPIHG